MIYFTHTRINNICEICVHIISIYICITFLHMPSWFVHTYVIMGAYWGYIYIYIYLYMHLHAFSSTTCTFSQWHHSKLGAKKGKDASLDGGTPLQNMQGCFETFWRNMRFLKGDCHMHFGACFFFWNMQFEYIFTCLMESYNTSACWWGLSCWFCGASFENLDEARAGWMLMAALAGVRSFLRIVFQERRRRRETTNSRTSYLSSRLGGIDLVRKSVQPCFGTEHGDCYIFTNLSQTILQSRLWMRTSLCSIIWFNGWVSSGSLHEHMSDARRNEKTTCQGSKDRIPGEVASWDLGSGKPQRKMHSRLCNGAASLGKCVPGVMLPLQSVPKTFSIIFSGTASAVTGWCHKGGFAARSPTWTSRPGAWMLDRLLTFAAKVGMADYIEYKWRSLTTLDAV